MKKMMMATAVATMVLGLGVAAWAHSPVCSCYDGGDGSVICEGGFSDGSSAAGVVMLVQDGSGKELMRGAMGKSGEYTFKKPAGDYQVIFDAGEGHRVTIKGKDIVP